MRSDFSDITHSTSVTGSVTHSICATSTKCDRISHFCVSPVITHPKIQHPACAVSAVAYLMCYISCHALYILISY